MLKAENLSIGYEENAVMSGVNLQIDSGEFMGIIGVNGSGKSTLLKSLCGIIQVLSGSLTYKAGKVLGPTETLIPGHKDMKMLAQDSKVDHFMTCRENLETCFTQKSEVFIKSRIEILASTFGLSHFLDVAPKSISGGQKQRLALAMTLAEPPEVLLLDEPFSQIDQIGAFELLKGLKEFQRSIDLTIIMVSHQTSHIRMFSDRCIVLDSGKICQDGTFEHIYQNPINNTAARLTGFFGTIDNQIVRPEDVILSEGSNKATIIESLKIAGAYLVELEFKNERFYSFSENFIPSSETIHFKLRT